MSRNNGEDLHQYLSSLFASDIETDDESTPASNAVDSRIDSENVRAQVSQRSDESRNLEIVCAGPYGDGERVGTRPLTNGLVLGRSVINEFLYDMGRIGTRVLTKDFDQPTDERSPKLQVGCTTCRL